ncbi:uncharacterized protein Asalp_41490 [Aeromonas salmonicida subsp. pectinolytica 34mel]|uniref:Uncharacterized protein n=1 Tax=Aeromonas salmonicida subsp. pectinolytica 34mel TaxID=1324960 RepID=A0A2D1QLT1_AERSA|nr:uncharacterized protein Asalp_41490 [Aeromonas salmonicida subsp. pectinolytica 34mel]
MAPCFRYRLQQGEIQDPDVTLCYKIGFNWQSSDTGLVFT